jgi:hypothetical protein
MKKQSIKLSDIKKQMENDENTIDIHILRFAFCLAAGILIGISLIYFGNNLIN